MGMFPSMPIISVAADGAPRPQPRAGGTDHGAASTRQPQPVDGAPRVYVASPLTTFQTARYDAKLRQISTRFPTAKLLPARDLFRSTTEWQEQWPLLLPTLAALVFFSETNGTIGLGVWSELHDAVESLPVWYLDDGGQCLPLDAFSVTITGDSLSRFAVVEVNDHAAGDASDAQVSVAGGG